MLRRDVFETFVGNSSAVLLSLVSASILARFLGPSDRGLLALAMLVPTIAATFCRSGQETVNVTYAGLYKEKRKSLFLQTIIVAVAGGLVSFLVVLAFFFWLPLDRGEFSRLSPEMVHIACLAAPVLILWSTIIALVRGVGFITTAARINLVQTAFGVGLLGLFIALLGYGLKTAILLIALSPLAGAALAMWKLRPYVTLRPSVFSVKLFKKSLGFGSLISASAVAGFLLYRIDQGILAYMVPAKQLGLYVVAVGFAEKLKMLPTSIASAFLPRLANDLEITQSQVPPLFRYTMVVSSGAMLLAGVLGAPAILLLFGDEYAGSIVPFLILLPGVWALGGSSVIASDLIARQKPVYSVAIGYCMLGINIALNFSLIPIIGIAGSALASSITYISALIIRLFCYRRETGQPLKEIAPTWADCVYVLSVIWDMLKQFSPSFVKRQTR